MHDEEFNKHKVLEVLDGLLESDQVVLEGAYALAQDAPVQISGE